MSRLDVPRPITTRRITQALLLAGILLPLVVSRASAGAVVTRPGGPAVIARAAQTLDVERTGVRSPRGLAFSPGAESFYVVASETAAAPAATAVTTLKPFALQAGSDRAGVARIAAAVANPINIAFDARRGRLLLLGRAGELLEVQSRANGALDATTLRRREARRLALGDPQGMAVDPASGTLFVLDAKGPRVVRVEPDAKDGFAAAIITEIELSAIDTVTVRGLAFDPDTGHLQIGTGDELIELSTAGEIAAVRDLSGLGLASPQGLTIAPSSDQTDPPGEQSVYVADGGALAGSGEIVELSLTRLAAASIDYTSSRVETIDAAGWDPRSPDTSGLAYLPGKNRLVVVDAEVEETVQGITHFQGANLWEIDLGGTVLRTANISARPPTGVPMTDEPTDVAFDPVRNVYYVTDDDRKRVYRLFPGDDDVVGTADDSFNFFRTTANGNTNGDPEGIASDPARNRLFVADGVNAEVYEYTPTGRLVGHFDVERYGVTDPEAIEFNTASGTLFTISNRTSGPIIVETTASGVLLQTVGVSASGAQKPAGLTYAPASDGSGAKRFYIADRGVDNNSDPNAVDGKIYEMTAPPVAPSRPPAECPGFEGDPRNHVVGTAGPDVLGGTSGNDIICGFGGNDDIRGRGGNDLVLAGGGADLVRGGGGADVVKGGRGGDTLQGGAGNDRLLGQHGRDLLGGGSGADLLRGGRGADTLRGGAGSDRLFGEGGRDVLNGGSGADVLRQ